MKLRDVSNLSDYKYVADLPGNPDASIHLIKIPALWEKGRYQAEKSASAFNRRQMHNIFGVHPYRFELGHTLDHVAALIRDMEVYKRRGGDHHWAEMNVILHDSIYAFYDAVGYDYKKKKYIRPIDFTS